MASGDQSRVIEAVIRAKNESAAALSEFNGSLLGIAATAAAVAAALYGLKEVFALAIDAAAEQEVADVRLAAALRTIGQNTKATREDLSKFASQMQDSLGIADEKVQETMAVFVQFGHLSGEELKRATKAALDFAASTGGDAASAALAMSKGLEGGQARLAGMSIKFAEGATKAEKFAQLMNLVEGNTVGTAAALGDTFSGALDKVNNAFSDLEEALGDVLIKNPAVKQVFVELVGLLQQFTGAIKENQSIISSWISLVIKQAAAGLDLAVKVAQIVDKTNAVSIAMKLMTANTTGALNDALLAVTGHGEEFKSTLDRLHESLKKIQDAAGATVPPLVDVAEHLGKGKGGAAGATEELTEAQKKAAEEMRKWEGDFQQFISTTDVSRQAVKNLGNEILAQFEEAIRPTLLQMSQGVDIFVNKGISGLNDAVRESNIQFQSLGDTIKTDIRAAGVDAALAVGDALVDAAINGGVSFKELFKALLTDLAKAIVRALILRAILAFATSGGSEAAGEALAQPYARFAVGEIGGPGASGGFVKGGIPGVDSALARLQPGEIVLPTSLRDDFQAIAALGRQASGGDAGSGARGGMGAFHGLFQIVPRRDRAELAELIEDINVAVVRHNYTLHASHILE